ncbi:bleomycin hydrolase [Coemansia sp. Benny D160-2]|nr:bleomycin hydrolase [Coemansia sp. Benny D160-2]
MDVPSTDQLSSSSPTTAEYILVEYNGKLPEETYKSDDSGVDDDSKSTQEVTLGQLEYYSDDFDTDLKNRLAALTISNGSYTSALENRKVYLNHPPVFSHTLETDNPITDQKNSGRCWIFAGFNMLRHSMIKNCNLAKLELSQSFIFFYDKLEKSNWFLENVLKTLDEDIDGHAMRFLLKNPVQDGGQWSMFVALVEKYGVVPKDVFPDTFHASDSEQLVWLLSVKLREYAKNMRNEHAKGKDIDEIRRMKGQMLKEIHRVVSVSLGQPPSTFNWTFYDKDKKAHGLKNVTPLQFYKDYVKQDCKNFVSLINDPRNEYMRKYLVEYQGNVYGGNPVEFVNLDMDRIKKYVVSVVKSGRHVWFGCDMGKFYSAKHALMDPELIDYKSAFDFDFGMTKMERMQFGECTMTHIMVLTGVHVEDDGKPVRWRVENSYGESVGDKGYLTMTDKWFDEYVFQVVLEKRDLPNDVLDVLDQEAAVLPFWDIFGIMGP